MRQVPHYLIIGNGRIAKHICFYFQTLNLSFRTWARSTSPVEILSLELLQATHVIFLIKDEAIDAFIKDHIVHHSNKAVLIHFSGSLISQYAYSAHPLHTFSYDLYPAESYKKIPFIIESNGIEFTELLPGLNNPHYKIESAKKAYYHALCVMANNFTTLLWQKFFSSMSETFNIEREHLIPYLQQTFCNLENNIQNALTGPIARGDKNTLIKNLNALNGDNYFEIFRAFVITHLPEIKNNEYF